MVISACVVTMAGGFGLGWAFFASQANENAGKFQRETVAPANKLSNRAAPAASPAQIPAASQAAARVSANTPAPASRSTAITITVRDWSLTPGTPVASPLRGEVGHAYLVKARRVRKGEKLFELKRRRAPTARSKELATRIAELEKLAQTDPVYREFLIRARREYRKAQKTVRATVTARSSGWFQPEAKRGQHVAEGEPLATMVDQRVRVGRVTLSGADVHPNWSCAPSGARLRAHTSCRITQVVDMEGGQVVSLRVEAERTRWSRGLEGKEFVLAPQDIAADH